MYSKRTNKYNPKSFYNISDITTYIRTKKCFNNYNAFFHDYGFFCNENNIKISTSFKTY